ncbi:hypothetical protein QI633_04065 [Nocardioides sp. QY071]|nr:hypothetical protein [Nocardioides sp. QY071]WGY04753.1 hypothetical protein QI633_04065 [Nocardioides sp. QY071]
MTEVGGARRGKAVIILNPAESPLMVWDTGLTRVQPPARPCPRRPGRIVGVGQDDCSSRRVDYLPLPPRVRLKLWTLHLFSKYSTIDLDILRDGDVRSRRQEQATVAVSPASMGVFVERTRDSDRNSEPSGEAQARREGQGFESPHLHQADRVPEPHSRHRNPASFPPPTPLAGAHVGDRSTSGERVRGGCPHGVCA